MYVNPSTSYEAVLNDGTTGLVGDVELATLDNVGGTTQAYSIASITEIAAGIYAAVRTSPGTSGQYTLVWKLASTGEIRGVEDLVVTSDVESVVVGSGNLYVTSANLKATLELDGETYADDDIAVAVSAASRVIDSYKDARYYPTTETHQYTAESCEVSLPIDDLNTLTSLSVDVDGDGVYETTWTADTDFYLEPKNAALTGRPYDQVSLRRQGGKVWPTWQYGVQIVGSFGWAAAPSQVTQAATILAGRYLKRARETPYGIITIGTDSLAAARLGKIDPDVAFLLDNLDADAPTLIL